MRRSWARARSFLVVAAQQAGALEASLASEADAVVVELPGPSPAGPPSMVQRATCAWLQRSSGLVPRPLLAVQVEGVRSAADLAAIMPGRPDAILLAACRGPTDLGQLGARLAVHEAELGLTDGSTRIVAAISDSAGLASLFAAPGYGGAARRLVGLTWNAIRLGDDLGADVSATATGTGAGPMELARAMTLVAARAAGVAAIDTEQIASPPEAFAELCRTLRQMGYRAKMTRHPAEVAIINAAFDTG